jgi:hypothetical protein
MGRNTMRNSINNAMRQRNLTDYLKDKTEKMNKLFYILREKGETQYFFCGQQVEAEPNEVIDWGYGQELSYHQAEEIGFCKSFATLEEANTYWEDENEAMEGSDAYARRQMYLEDRYGYEGVDVDEDY